MVRKKRVVLTFPPSLVDKPITYHLVKDYGLVFNILKARVTPREEGRLVLEIEGKREDLNKGIKFLKSLGIRIEPLAQDIRWIKDVDELRNQLACALKVPLQLLGGYQEELPSSLGQSSLERLDIRFARQSRRIQRALINGITRMVQIHLAYQGIDPDLNLFQVQMAETSTAEEEELKNALDKGVDVVGKLSEYVETMFGPDVNKEELFDYLKKKFVKLNEFDLEKILKNPEG